MKTEYRGYKIEVTAKRKDGLWAAEVWLWTLDQTESPTTEWMEVQGHSSEDRAEAAGLICAKARVDKLVDARSPIL
jgi:hypothetical protein